MTKQKIIFYIDGFNLFYGLKSKKWKPFYWLDIVGFCEKFVKPHQELIEVNYFTAIPKDKGKHDRLDLLLSANKLNKKLNIHFGRYLDKSKKCYSCNNIIRDYEEKQTDVNIAVQMIRNVIYGRNDISILISADSDLVPPIDFIREFSANHKIFIYFPPNRHSYDLKNKSNKTINLDNHYDVFANSTLMEEIELPSGYKITRPSNWK